MNIAVSVTDGTDAIGGVSVQIEDTTDSTKKFTGTTGNAGGCTLSNVPLGSYTVSATKEGYNNYSDSLTVTDETTSLSIEMTAEEEVTPGGG